MPRKGYYQRFAFLGLDSKEQYAEFFKLNKVKLSKSSVANHFPEFAKLVETVADGYPAGSYSELVYAYLHDLTQPPVCRQCGNARVKFKQFSHGYFAYCSVGCSSNSQEKKAAIAETNMGRYGVANPSSSPQVQRRREATFMARYGVPAALAHAEFAQAARQTCEARYGDPHFFASDAGKRAVAQGTQRIYGVENPMRCPEIAQRSLQTRIEKGLVCKWTAAAENSLNLYRLAVRMHSEKTYRKHFYQLNPEKKRRSKHQYHLDHIFPVVEGWQQGVAPELMAHPNNLQLLWCTDNIVKGARTESNAADFYRRIGVQAGASEE